MHLGLPPQTASPRIDSNRLVFEAAPAFDAGSYITDPLLKSAFHDPRVLLKPETSTQSPKNSRRFSISDCTLSLAHASLLGQIYIAPDQNLVIGSDDLKRLLSRVHCIRHPCW